MKRIVIFLATLIALGISASENLLPGFAQWYKNPSCQYDPAQRRDGREVMTVKVPAKGFGACQSPLLKVKPNTRYRISYQVTTQEFAGSKAYVYLQIGKRQQIFPSCYRSGDHPWTNIDISYITRAEETSLRLLLTVYGKGGTASFTLPDFREESRSENAVELPFRKTAGLVKKADGQLVPDRKVLSSPDDILYFQADQGEVHYLAGGGARRDEAGNPYIVDVDGARYVFFLKKAGRYRRWFRTWRPVPARYCHPESMDGKTDGKLHDDFIRGVKTWEWVPGPVYDLGAGYHELVLHSFSGGIRLGSVLFAPEDLTPDRLADRAPAKAGYGPYLELETAPVKFPAEKWLSAFLKHDPADLKCRVEVSADGGRTFRKAEMKQGKIVPAPEQGSPVIRLRIETAGQDLDHLRLAGAVRCGCIMKKQAGMTFRAGQGEYTINREDGSLLSVRNVRTDQFIVRPGGTGGIFALTLRKPGSEQETRLTDRDFRLDRVKEERTAAEFSFRNDPRRIGVTVRYDFGGPEAVWGIRVENGDPEQYVIRTAFPCFAELSIGKTPADDVLIFPQSYYKRLYPARGGRPLSKNAVFPANMCMGWTDLYDPADGGFYLMIDDPDFLLTRMDCGPSAGNNGAMMLFEKQHSVPPRGAAEFRYRTAVHDGDWHAAADLYRAWASKHVRRADLPQWLRECNGIYANAIQYRQKTGFTSLPGIYRYAAAYGLDGLVSWGQQSYFRGPCGDGFYYPSPCFGTADELKAADHAIRADGGHSGFYQWMNWNAKYETSDSVAFGKIPKKDLPSGLYYPAPGHCERNQVIQANGKPHFFTLKSMLGHNNYLICPGSEEHRKYLEYYAVLYARDFESSGFYMDEGISQARQCFNMKHGHFGDGSCGREMAENLRRITQAARKYNPDFFLTPEVVNCVAGQYGAHFVGVFEPDLEIVKYTFPDQIYLDGNLPVARQKAPLATLETIFLLGNHLFLWPYGNILERPDCQAVIQLRRSLRLYFADGKFRDTVGFSLERTDGKIQVKRFECERPDFAGELFTVLNPERKSTKLRIGRKNGAAWCFDPNGGLSRIPITDHFLTLPAERLCAILVPERMAPGYFLHQVRLSRKELRFKIANPGEKAIRIEFTLELNGKPGCRLEGTVPPGEVLEWVHPMPEIPGGEKYPAASWRIVSGSFSASDRTRLR